MNRSILSAVERKRREIPGAKVNCLSFHLPADVQKDVSETLQEWTIQGKVRRLWDKDPTLWTNKDEADWLGWLDITKDNPDRIQELDVLARQVSRAGFTHVLLLGMGGSSLCPEVMKTTFGRIEGYPELRVLDSTDPSQIATFESEIDLKKTLFIVSSKSGSTLESIILKQYFFEKIKAMFGAKEAGRRFLAITDPGSEMQRVAEKDGFWKIFFGAASIGGRYSALSDFGMVPSAIMGVNIAKFWDRTRLMVNSCSASIPPENNPGVILGVILGVCAGHGRDKVTILTSPAYRSLGAWLEQLLAESLGKQGKGLIPVDLERMGDPRVYGRDRLFVTIRCDAGVDPAWEKAVEKLRWEGHPVVTIKAADAYEIGQEFFRWEIATAVAGSILGINPFDQPDVEASKVATRKLTTEYEKTRKLPAETAFFRENNMSLFTDRKNAEELTNTAGRISSITSFLGAHLGRLGPGNYFAVLAYVESNATNEDLLQTLRFAVGDKKRVATCLGFGPRFLHSTGQAYKGGPNSGVFLQVTCDASKDIPVPGRKYSFGVVQAAQALGDFEVLAERRRRVLRVHLGGGDVKKGLTFLKGAIIESLK